MRKLATSGTARASEKHARYAHNDLVVSSTTMARMDPTYTCTVCHTAEPAISSRPARPASTISLSKLNIMPTRPIAISVSTSPSYPSSQPVPSASAASTTPITIFSRNAEMTSRPSSAGSRAMCLTMY